MRFSLLFGLLGAVAAVHAKRDTFRQQLLTPNGAVDFDVLADGLLITNTHGARFSVRWTDVDRWLDGKGYLLLATKTEHGIIIPAAALAPAELAAVTSALTATVGRPKRERTTFLSERGLLASLARLTLLVVLGVLIVFVLLGTVLWLTGYGEETPQRDIDATEQSDRPSSEPAVMSDDLSQPLQPGDVPGHCRNLSSSERPDWMCFDDTGAPEWTVSELPPGCRMVPFRGNIFMDCEGASGPGR